MSETDKEITACSPRIEGMPPQGVMVPSGDTVTSWRPEFDLLRVEYGPGGVRYLTCAQGAQRLCFELTPEAAGHLATLLAAEYRTGNFGGRIL